MGPLDGADLVAIGVIAVLFASSLFLAAAETALTRMSKGKALGLQEAGRRGADQLVHLVSDPSRFLNPLLLVSLVCQLVQATLVGVVASNELGPRGVILAAMVNVLVVFVIAESAPKTWALQHPSRSALLVAPPVAWLVAFAPIRWLSSGLIGLSNIILPGKGLPDGPYVTGAEILAMANDAAESDAITTPERDLIVQALAFGDTVVREVMVPRTDMVAVPDNFMVADVVEVAILNGLSRLPTIGESIDDVRGIVYVKDLMRAERDGLGGAKVDTLMRPVQLVFESKPLDELLHEMQSERFHMAVVVDEYGSTAGLVTLEDLIEELVGEIVDEFDADEPVTETLPHGGWRLDARTPVDEVNTLITARIKEGAAGGETLPEGDWDSIGGLLIHSVGRAPTSGDRAEVCGWSLVAERVQGRRVVVVRIEPTAESSPSLAEASPGTAES